MSKKDPETGIENLPATTADARDDAALPTTLGSLVSEHPLAAAGAAIAAGAVIGMMLPRARIGSKVATTSGSAIAGAARNAAKAIAAVESARALLSTISAATGTLKDGVKDGAHRIADHVPDSSAVKAGAKRALERAGETAQKAGEQVARKVRRTAKSVED